VKSLFFTPIVVGFIEQFISLQNEPALVGSIGSTGFWVLFWN
jgi:hypothetical protein